MRGAARRPCAWTRAAGAPQNDAHRWRPCAAAPNPEEIELDDEGAGEEDTDFVDDDGDEPGGPVDPALAAVLAGSTGAAAAVADNPEEIALDEE